MSNPETHTCPYCKHTWIHGTTGDHNCLANIILQREEAKETLARLRQDLQDPPADVQEAVLDKLKLRDVIPNLTDFLEWNKFADRGMTLLEALTILNNRHLEAVAAVQAQRNLLLEACVNLENDDGSIPASAWNLIQSAVAASGGTPKQIPEETMRQGYALRCRMRETDALAIELRESLLETQSIAIKLRNQLEAALPTIDDALQDVKHKSKGNDEGWARVEGAFKKQSQTIRATLAEAKQILP